jgi:MYXO-CTERM domain-containing protein
VDGNNAGAVAGLGGTIGGLEWAAGETLWLRWVERNDAGSDHGLAIDNLSFSSVPEPSEYATAAAAMLVLALACRRRRRPVDGN